MILSVALKSIPEAEHTKSYWWSARQTEQVLDEYTNRQKSVAVVVPARNEARGLAEILAACRQYSDELLVVDGHSVDATAEIARAAGATVVQDGGGGKGDAIRTAIAGVTSDIIVFLDADFSHDPADIPRLVVPILRDEADHVAGSRTRGGSDELHGDLNKFLRMIGSDIITLGINYRFGVRLTDSQNGLRAIRTDVARSLNLCEQITTIEQEMTIKTIRKGYRILEIPTHEYARRYGESQIWLSRVWFRYVYSWLRYMLWD